MFLKNEAARLITINFLVDGVETGYPILPGENPAVEVPDEAAKIDFVKALLKSGDLRRVGADELGDDDEGDDDSDGVIAQLQEEAAGLGIEVNPVWKEARLRKEIAKARS